MNIARGVERIANDKRHGAAWLAARAAALLVQAAERRSDPREWLETARRIAASHPAMAALTNTSACFASSLPVDGDTGAARAAARLSAQVLVDYWRKAPESIVRLHASRFTGVVMTHSSSSDVLRVLLHAQPRLVFITESRPGRESLDSVRALVNARIAVTLIPDSACGYFVGEADVVLLGADAVLATGAIVNKVGSYPLALAARDTGRSVLVAAETMKITPNLDTVLEPAPARMLPRVNQGVTARSPLFEIVPVQWISAILTEEGELNPDGLQRHAAEFGVKRRVLAIEASR